MHVVINAEEEKTCVGCLYISVWFPEQIFRWFHWVLWVLIPIFELIAIPIQLEYRIPLVEEECSLCLNLVWGILRSCNCCVDYYRSYFYIFQGIFLIWLRGADRMFVSIIKSNYRKIVTDTLNQSNIWLAFVVANNSWMEHSSLIVGI